MTKPGMRNTLSIPNHSEVKRRTLQKLIQAAEMTEAEYLECFDKKAWKRAQRTSGSTPPSIPPN